MTVRIRTFLLLGAVVGLLGAGYVFAPQPGAATVSVAPIATPEPATTTAAAPMARPASTLVANRPPVPLVTRTPSSYFKPEKADSPVQPASASQGPNFDDTTGSSDAKAAIELDGYKNVRGLEKGPDGVWRGRAMRGRTEIAIRVDATGSVSAD